MRLEGRYKVDDAAKVNTSARIVPELFKLMATISRLERHTMPFSVALEDFNYEV